MDKLSTPLIDPAMPRNLSSWLRLQGKDHGITLLSKARDSRNSKLTMVEV
jgi:hypothetical protein